MKTCPNCNLYFNDGYACPQCGGALYDQDPYAQQMPYEQYPTQPYGYQQQGYVQQPYGYQQTQPYAMPEPAPAYAEPEPEPIAPVSTAVPTKTIVMKQGSRGKTVAIVLLALIAVALGALCAFQFITNGKGSEPTELESAVAQSAWTWQTSVSDLLDEMDASTVALMNQASSASTEAEAAEDAAAAAENAEGATATTVENAEATADEAEAQADEATATEAEQQAATEDTTDIAEAEALVEGAEGQTTDATAQQPTTDQVSQLMEYAVALAALASDDQIKAVDAPMQALREEYPDMVTAWDEVRQTVTDYAQGLAQEPEDQSATESTTEAPTDAATAPAPEDEQATAQDETTNAQQDATTATQDEPADEELSVWEQFLDSFRAAMDAFNQAASAAGFTLS